MARMRSTCDTARSTLASLNGGRPRSPSPLEDTVRPGSEDGQGERSVGSQPPSIVPIDGRAPDAADEGLFVGRGQGGVTHSRLAPEIDDAGMPRGEQLFRRPRQRTPHAVKWACHRWNVESPLFGVDTDEILEAVEAATPI